MKTMNIITEGEQDGHGRLLFTATWIDPDNQGNRGQVFHARLDEHIKDGKSMGWEVIVNRKEVDERPGALDGGADRLYVQTMRQ